MKICSAEIETERPKENEPNDLLHQTCFHNEMNETKLYIHLLVIVCSNL